MLVEWREGELADSIAVIRNGTTAQQVDTATPYPVSRIETISEGEIDWSRVGFLQCDEPGYQLKPGDILYSHINSLKHMGKVAQYEGGRPLIHGMNLMLLRFADQVDPRFMFRVLQSERARAHARREAKSAINQASLGQHQIVGLTLRYPPLPEQRRIAEILDTADEAIRKTEQVIAKLRQMKQGLLHDLLTRGIDENGGLRDPQRHPERFKDSPLGRIPKEWEVSRLEELTSRRIVDGVHHTPAYAPAGVPFLTVENLTRGAGISFTPCRYVSERDHKQYYMRADPLPGDVLVSKDGTLGVARIVPQGAPEFSIFVSVALLRPDPGRVLPDLLHRFFDSEFYERQISIQSAGTGLKHIHLEHFRAFLVPVPSLAEQRVMFAALKLRDQTIVDELSVLAKLRLLKQGLMDDLLTGRVRVNVKETTP